MNNNFFQGTPKKDEPTRSWMGQNTSQLLNFNNTNNVQGQQNNALQPFQPAPIFGQKQPTTPMFGSNQAAQPSLNTFGSSSFTQFSPTTNQTPFNTTSTQPMFNSSVASVSPFNNSTIQPSFGSTPNTFNNTTFGNTTTPPQQSTFGMQPFNSTTQQPFNMTTFGNTTTQPAFGTTNSMFNQQSSSTAPSSFPNTFNQYNPTNSGFSSSGLATQQPSFNQPQGTASWNAPTVPSWGMNEKGSKGTPYTITRITDDNHMSVDLLDITGMKNFTKKSVDEIRTEDYEMSLCPPKQQPSAFGLSNVNNTSNFGLSNTSGIGRPFNSTTPSQSPFNSTSTPTSMFGSSLAKPIASTNLFSNTNTSSSNQPLANSFLNNGFSNNNAQTASLNAQPLFGQPSSSLFNQPNTSNQTSVFGMNKLSQPQTTLFGQSIANPPALPTQNQTGMFGQTNNDQTSLVGQSNATQQPVFGMNNTAQTNPFGQSSTVNPFASNTTSSNQLQSQPQQSMFNNTQNLFNARPSDTPLFGSQANNQLNLQAKPNTLQPLNFTNNPFAQQQNMFNPPNTMTNNNDPYLLKNVNFDKFEQQKPTIRIHPPAPIFKTQKETTTVDLKIRPPRPVYKNAFYTIPDIRDIGASQSVSNLVIGFEGKGRIEFLEPVTLNTAEDIENRVSFRNESVEVNDPIGTGLNKKARIFVEGLYPMCRTTNEIIKGKADSFPQKGIQERFIYQLKNDPLKKFVDYNVDNGIYVYEVNHFN